MLIQTAPDVYDKLRHLGGMATDDVLTPNAVPSARSMEYKTRSGYTPIAGVYRAAMPNGKRISLLRVMFSDHCMMDCHYCPNSYWVPRRRYGFTVDELAKVFDTMHSRHQVDGLFLSSGIFGSPDQTMERLVGVVEVLRNRYGFQGYVHLKVMPGSSPDAVHAAARLGTRLSINMESPTREHLEKVTGMKRFDEGMLAPMRAVQGLMAERYGTAVGQATQLVVGAADESDWDVYLRQRQLYNEFQFKRVYYNAFRPIQFTPLELHAPTPPIREHRLYQMDWLSRIYKFTEDEMRPAFGQDGHLDLNVDPKLTIAMQQIDRFPLDVNVASHDDLLRVPGIGPLAAQRIVQQRKQHSIGRWQELKAMGVIVKRAQPFIRYVGHKPELVRQAQLPLLAALSSDPVPAIAQPEAPASGKKSIAISPAGFEAIHQKHIGTGCATCPLHQSACGGVSTAA